MTNSPEQLLIHAISAALKASVEILSIYNSPFAVEMKEDKSPLTAADKASHAIITSELAELGVPVLSEEGQFDSFNIRGAWNKFWLVDPLDGTKEFIKRNGEFTINIALLEKNQPVMGVIHGPVWDVLYAGYGNSLFRIEKASQQSIRSIADLNNFLIKPSVSGDSESLVRVLASRSHMSPETQSFVRDLEKKYSKVELLSAGSALKFCLLAEGKADVYPRFAPTMEWDTAAGHALLKTVGKNILLVHSGLEMPYNKHSLVNDWFIAK